MENKDTYFEASQEEYAILGKWFVDMVAHEGMPQNPENFTKRKVITAQAIGVSVHELERYNRLLFELSTQHAEKRRKREPIGFLDKIKSKIC